MAIIAFIIINLVTFVALALVLRKIIFSSSYDETKRLQQLNIENTKKANELDEKIEDAEKKYKEKITQAGDEIRKMKEKAKEEAQQIREDTLAKIREEKGRLIGQALNAKEKLREEIEGELLEKSIGFAKRILEEILGSPYRRLVYDSLIEEIFNDLSQIDQDAFKDVDWTSLVPQVKTSHEMSSVQRERLEQILFEKSGKRIGIVPMVDKTLIAGIIVQIGSLMIDGSLAAKFRKTAEDIKHAH